MTGPAANEIARSRSHPVARFGLWLGSLLFAIALTIGLAGVITPGSTNIAEEDYLSATLDKHRLIAQTPSPKVILVGGSGMALGMDSGEAQRSLRRNVVNMGLYAGLGLRTMLDEIRPYVNAGDVIYIAPEYQLYFKETRRNDDAIATLTRMSFPANTAYLSPATYFRALGTFYANEQRALGEWLSAPFNRRAGNAAAPQTANAVDYFRAGFDARGDYVAHLGKPGKDLSQLKLINQKRITFDDDAADALNEFFDFARAKGATAVLAFPPIPAMLAHDNAGTLSALVERLRGSVRMPMTGSPQQSALPLDDFYDTVYHLNAEGRAKRTQDVIESLRAVISTP